jgi:hypothetical protein
MDALPALRDARSKALQRPREATSVAPALGNPPLRASGSASEAGLTIRLANSAFG